MRSIALAALVALSTAASAMALPSMPLPDLTFPAPDGDVTQGCTDLIGGVTTCE
ncbi:hypothetical protein TRP8649_03930 [Pelagimonas phthalicica]|uniref:Uncharacterized protein n=1 Tax=Pelagimonas phthalicica TaxID=1037362 RepID=A0A238JGG7_9RHOB|nr:MULTISPECIES: hypothetical protein [Roseobacteraceae]MBO9465938.1 hypothetical protein [Tropicibacter sp. R15_0]TDS89033.1 hypothetical protein CLV87_4222 [Pelagimonas phthalicica]SMX29791.1 hypothetical protein TRP8649_03930 [Pelagimonas phthalicica]